MSHFKLRLILSFFLAILFIACVEVEKELLNESIKDTNTPTIASYSNSKLAQINEETVLTIFGPTFKLNGTPPNSTMQYRSKPYSFNPNDYEHTNKTNDNINGTKTYTFKPNKFEKTFTQTYNYQEWVNEQYDAVCDKYAKINYLYYYKKEKKTKTTL